MGWEFELVAGPYDGIADGLAWDGEGVLFCVVGGFRGEESPILRYDPRSGAVTEFRKYSSGTRGLCFDAEGKLYGCQSASRRIVRFNRDGSTTPMEYRIDGCFHNHPDDLVADSEGRVWFNAPIDPIPVGGAAKPLLDHASVLRLERDARGSREIRRMTFDTVAPRGARLSEDEQTLYVAESSDQPGATPELRAYPILQDGTLVGQFPWS